MELAKTHTQSGPGAEQTDGNIITTTIDKVVNWDEKIPCGRCRSVPPAVL